MFNAQWQSGVPTITIHETIDPASSKLQTMHLQIDLAGVDPQTVRRV